MPQFAPEGLARAALAHIGLAWWLAAMIDLIAVDWGTTSFRAYRVRAGLAMDAVGGPHGILSVKPGEHAATLRSMIGEWLPAPVVMSGMIGSRQGWKEAPYAPCPAGAGEIARAALRWDEPGIGAITLLPGVTTEHASGMPDVMRGEETQVFGALAALGRDEGVFITPGTHSKRITVEGGRIVSFASYMTGEVFAALKDHTILARLMAEGEPDGTGFRDGISAAARLQGPGDLLNAVFGARTLGLFDRLPGRELADYLSGLLIGAELVSALPEGGEGVVIGSDALAARYGAAAEALGRRLVKAPPDCVARGQIAVLAAGGGA
jgi:2-dehydro-3-deoxygalactonokinase